MNYLDDVYDFFASLLRNTHEDIFDITIWYDGTVQFDYFGSSFVRTYRYDDVIPLKPIIFADQSIHYVVFNFSNRIGIYITFSTKTDSTHRTTFDDGREWFKKHIMVV